jgi:opacity protein-like surface antigen
MRSLLASVFALAALAPAAHAGTYVGLGIGTGAHTDGGLGVFDSTNNHSGRAVLGDSLGIVSIEGGVGYFGLVNNGHTYDAVSLGVAAKLSVPVTPLLHPYVRVGLEHTNLSAENGVNFSTSGDGWTGGLGLEYKLAALSIWADYSKHTVNLDNGKFDGAASMLTIGLSFGI